MHEEKVRAVAEALEALKKEAPSIAGLIAEEVQAAGSGLEYYGIVKGELSKVVESRELAEETKSKVRAAIRAVLEIYQS